MCELAIRLLDLVHPRSLPFLCSLHYTSPVSGKVGFAPAKNRKKSADMKEHFMRQDAGGSSSNHLVRGHLLKASAGSTEPPMQQALCIMCVKRGQVQGLTQSQLVCPAFLPSLDLDSMPCEMI